MAKLAWVLNIAIIVFSAWGFALLWAIDNPTFLWFLIILAAGELVAHLALFTQPGFQFLLNLLDTTDLGFVGLVNFFALVGFSAGVTVGLYPAIAENLNSSTGLYAVIVGCAGLIGFILWPRTPETHTHLHFGEEGGEEDGGF